MLCGEFYLFLRGMNETQVTDHIRRIETKWVTEAMRHDI